ncbi:MAG: esterase [Myxococcales bacterium]|nr:esterase [Myxococcales bacterium]
MRRRTFLSGALVAACSRRDQKAPTPPAPPTPAPVTTPRDATVLGPRGEVELREWDMGDGMRAAVLVPTWAPPDVKFPVLVALHGRGEAMKGPALGAMGWPKDYALVRAYGRMCAPPLVDADFEGFVDDARKRAINDDLGKTPFGGLVVACPYLPDLELRKPEAIAPYARFIVDTLLPRVRRETPALTTAAATGIDGVSLGGAVALRAGLTHPEAFGAVGSLQAAIGEDQTEELTALARAARAKNPTLALRLLTSDKDYFKAAIHATSRAWKDAGVRHDMRLVPGPHDYPFNRGPGAIEMLYWHDRRLSHS